MSTYIDVSIHICVFMHVRICMSVYVYSCKHFRWHSTYTCLFRGLNKMYISVFMILVEIRACMQTLTYMYLHKYLNTCIHTHSPSVFFECHIPTGLNVLAKNRRNWCSQFLRFRPHSRNNEISEISPEQKCVIQIEMSNSRISCTLNGERRYCGWQNEAMLFKQTPEGRTCFHAAGALQLNS